MSFDPGQYPSPDPAEAPRAAAGWYPVDQVSQRYWDGYEWTAHLAPLNPSLTQNPVGAIRQMGSTSDDRTFAVLMHVGALFVGFVVPLVMWLIKKDESPLVDQHGRGIMNWHISSFIYAIVSFVLVFVGIGILMLLALMLMHLIFSIMGAVAANKGEAFTYPLSIPFF